MLNNMIIDYIEVQQISRRAKLQIMSAHTLRDDETQDILIAKLENREADDELLDRIKTKYVI